MSLQGIKLITFDATNTLLKFRVPPWQYYASIARNYGYQGTVNDLKEDLLKSYKIMWEKHPNFGKDSISWQSWWRLVVINTLQDHLPKTTNLNNIADHLIDEFKTTKCWCQADGGQHILGVLKKRNIRYIGVISNHDPRLHDVLRNVGLHKYFKFILTSYEIGYSKPQREIYEKAIQMCNTVVKPSESLHIGDNLEKDYKGARAAGWHALLVNENLKTETPPASTHVFNTLEQLASCIEEDRLVLC